MVNDLPLCGYFLVLHGQPGQGELQARGQYVKMYRGPLNGLLVMVRTDGLKAVQAGLAPAMMYQMVMNGLRLGSYAMLETAGFVQDSEGQLSLARCTLCSAASGLVGGVVGSPLFLVKTHLQTSSSATIAVGHQHRHRGAVAGLRDLYRAGGVTGLWQGVSASVPRISLGSAAQLVTYSHVNAALAANTRLAEGSWQVNLCGALLSGFVVAVVINPVDVVSTRLYNQPAQVRPMRGRSALCWLQARLYRSYTDCVLKIAQTEGVAAFYKGLLAQYLRIGPHSFLSLIFWHHSRNWLGLLEKR